MIQRNRWMHLTLFYGYFRKNPIRCRRSLLTTKLSTSTAISATSATALSGWRKSDNNDHHQAILFVWRCYFTVMFLLSLQHRVMHTKCLFHNQFSAIRNCQYEKCKTREKDEFFFIFFFSVFRNTCCCCFLSLFICSCYLSLLFSFVVRLSSKCVLFKFVLYE